MSKLPPTLTPDLRALCGRLANERTRRAAWELAAQIRSDALKRLLAGEPVETLASELQDAIRDAEELTRRLA